MSPKTQLSDFEFLQSRGWLKWPAFLIPKPLAEWCWQDPIKAASFNAHGWPVKVPMFTLEDAVIIQRHRDRISERKLKSQGARPCC